jgi:hypothetical protein
VSRHHILPPIVYTPAPRPKKVESRSTRRIQKHDGTSVTDTGDLEDTDEAFVADRAGRPVGDAVPNPFTPIEYGNGQTQQAPGKLSENTLKVMLQAQEIGNAPSASLGARPPTL